MPTLQPLDRDAVLDAAAHTRRLVTIEEHAGGGLGAAVAEVLAGVGHPVPLRTVRLPRGVIKTVGSQAHLRERLGVSVDAVLAALEDA
jgi:transketolase